MSPLAYCYINCSGVSCGIYTTNSPEACKYVIENVECQIVVVENTQQANKILTVVDSLPGVKAIVQYNGEPTDSRVISVMIKISLHGGSVRVCRDGVFPSAASFFCCSRYTHILAYTY